MSCSYILNINPLLSALSAKFFSQSVGHLFNLLMIAVQKLLSRSYLFILAFIFFFALDDPCKKILLRFTSGNVLPTFSSMLSRLIFWSLIKQF